MRRMMGTLAAVLAALAGVLAAQPAWAGTFTVQNGNDSGAGSLREAVASSNASAGADTIGFAPGVAEVVLSSGELNVTGDLTVQGPGAQQLAVRRRDTDFPDPFRLFRVSGSGARLKLEGLTLDNGRVEGQTALGGAVLNEGGTLEVVDARLTNNQAIAPKSDASSVARGGAIHSTGGTLRIAGSTLSGNSASGSDGYGGAVSHTGNATLTGSNFSGNSVSAGRDGYGGALYNTGGALTATDSTLSGNSVSAGHIGWGGAVYGAGGALTITDSTLSGNSTLITEGSDTGVALGGGVYASVGRGIEARISGSTFSSNKASAVSDVANVNYAWGGGAHFAGDGKFSVSGTTFTGNSAEAHTKDPNDTHSLVYAEAFGGAIYNSADYLSISTEITNSTFSGNSAQARVDDAGGWNDLDSLASGGAIHNRGTLGATNSTFSGNSVSAAAPQRFLRLSNVSGHGGAISRDERYGGFNLVTSSTVTANVVSGTHHSAGGGMWGSTVRGSLVAGNRVESEGGTEGPDVYAADSGGYNLIGDGSNSNLTSGTNGDQVGAAANPIDPKLGPLRDNGGPTETHALLPDSPAIDKGKSFGLTTDQRGEGRPNDASGIPSAAPEGDASDIGAFELQVNKVFLYAPGQQTVDEDDTLSFSSANGFSVSYPDGPDGGDTPVKITLTVRGGTLTLGDTTGLSFTEGDGTDDAAMTFSGKLSDVNAALDGSTLTPAEASGTGARLDMNAAVGLLNDDASVRVTVNNLPPAAEDDAHETGEGEALRVASPGVLKNDTDPGLDPLDAELVSGPTSGELILRGDGSFSYFPNDGYMGTDSFTYKASDGQGGSDTATVSIAVEDRTAPTVQRTWPAAGNRVVKASANVVVAFSETMKGTSFVPDTLTLVRRSTGEAVPASLGYMGGTDNRAVLNPTDDLVPGYYTATLKGGVAGAPEDASGNALPEGKTWTFGVNSAPVVSPLDPDPGSSTADPTPRIRAAVKDRESVLRAEHIKLALDGAEVTGFSYYAATGVVKWEPTAPLDPGWHRVEVTARDPQGLEKTRAWSFKIAP